MSRMESGSGPTDGAATSSVEDETAPETNGCGPPGWLGMLVPECPLGIAYFGTACDYHDRCYSTCEAVKAGCDAEFYAEMQAICTQQYAEDNPRRATCLDLAYIYWQAVVRFGGSSFESGQIERGCALADSAAALSIGAADFPPPFVDADDDLLPDEWEAAHGCDPTNPADALEDFDGDGLVNLQEYLYGLEPWQADVMPAR